VSLQYGLWNPESHAWLDRELVSTHVFCIARFPHPSHQAMQSLPRVGSQKVSPDKALIGISFVFSCVVCISYLRKISLHFSMYIKPSLPGFAWNLKLYLVNLLLIGVAITVVWHCLFHSWLNCWQNLLFIHNAMCKLWSYYPPVWHEIIGLAFVFLAKKILYGKRSVSTSSMSINKQNTLPSESEAANMFLVSGLSDS